jgi:hypothetical protein|nr:MobQ family relaxase [Mogibacterium neglectum]
MAIFSMNISIVSKSNGKSAVNSSAYIHRSKFKSESFGETFDYSRYKQDEPIHSEILLPKNAPSKFQNPQELWNSVELVEKNSNAQLSRRIILALPAELSADENKSLLRDYVQSTFVDEGMCADMAIHFDQHNPHAHILLTTRPLTEKGAWGSKERKTYALDELGKRIPILDGQGNQKIGSHGRKMWKRELTESTNWNNPKNAEIWREKWANTCNERLKEFNTSIDHRSYKRQGLNIEPTIHAGYSRIRQKFNRTVMKSRDLMNGMVEELKVLKTQILAFVNEPEINYIDTFPADWTQLDIDHYCCDRDIAWSLRVQALNYDGVEPDEEYYLEFCKEYAPTPENLAKWKERNEREQQEKLDREQSEFQKRMLEQRPAEQSEKEKISEFTSKKLQRSRDDDFEI